MPLWVERQNVQISVCLHLSSLSQQTLQGDELEIRTITKQ